MAEVNLTDVVHYLDVVDSSDGDALAAFQYKGKDDSILYEHVTSPGCQWIVEHWLPERFTPNQITLVGLLFVIVPHALIIFTAWDDKDLPHWAFYLMNGVGTLLYSIFDNLDGKQARHTGQASPLGMIVDHGCDCFNSVLNAMAISKMFGVSLNTQAVAVVLVVSAFYFATLEQYFTHYFYLPRVNQVNEGIVLLVLLALIGAATGKLG